MIPHLHRAGSYRFRRRVLSYRAGSREHGCHHHRNRGHFIEGATFNDSPHFAGGIVPRNGIFTAWSYRAGAERAEAFFLNPQPLTVRTAYDWGVVTEIVEDGEALSRALELASLYLKVPEATRRNTRVHFTQPREIDAGREQKLMSLAPCVRTRMSLE